MMSTDNQPRGTTDYDIITQASVQLMTALSDARALRFVEGAQPSFA